MLGQTLQPKTFQLLVDVPKWRISQFKVGFEKLEYLAQSLSITLSRRLPVHKRILVRCVRRVTEYLAASDRRLTWQWSPHKHMGRSWSRRGGVCKDRLDYSCSCVIIANRSNVF